MKYFFEGAFYDPEITPEIPEGATELTDDVWRELLEQQSAGKVITTGEDGIPVATDPPPPSAEEQAKLAAEQSEAPAEGEAVAEDGKVVIDGDIVTETKEAVAMDTVHIDGAED